MSQKTILIVEDDKDLREALCDTLELAGFAVAAAADGSSAIELLDQHVGMVVTDVQMQPMDGHELLKRIKAKRPQLPVVLMTAYGTIEKAVTAMQDGATDYLVKPFEANVLVNMVERVMATPLGDDQLIADDPATRELAELARRVAESEATVMISGESGTGKEVFARFIHNHSQRRDGPFVAINCAAIPENMLEAVLFGYEKGAFTGANSSHAGKFEQAQSGTLLLDEVSEMDLALQAKLLRVLQEKEVERLGGRKVIPLDVRVLATTNRHLRDYVSEGRFREDLFYRLNVFPLNLPPLRKRRGDILPLVEHALRRGCNGSRPVPMLSKEAEEALLAHDWPGNVRELENLIQRTLIMVNGKTVEASDLRFEPPGDHGHGAEIPEGGCGSALQEDLKSREQQLILDALQSERSRKAAAAKLGISPRTLRYKIARLKEMGVAVPA